ncbi:MAG: DUF4157 domain-containing protein [Timaviella obliquedivisa GSE-PSE-MK23-08B]|nr:DUF4157 domain-containing protein [Timaviella obliquedivisa GSE-PSE-MK23-08B]
MSLPKLQPKAALHRKSVNQSVQRSAEPEEEEELQMKPLASSIQREAEEEEEELQMKPAIQRRSDPGGRAASTDLESSINQARGSGQGLSDSIREPMEQAFGANFGNVRIHTDSQSDQLNRSINAQAFTTKNDIFFSKGKYDPSSKGGQELLAHELTHVVQQVGAIQRNPTLTSSQPLALDELKSGSGDKRDEAYEAGGGFAVGNTADALDGRADLLELSEQKPGEGEASTAVGFGMVNSLLSLGFALKKFGGAKSVGDKAMAVLSGAGGLVGLGEKITAAVKIGTKADDKSGVAVASSIMGTVGPGFSTLVGIVESTSKVQDVFKENDTKNETTFEKAMSAGSSVFQTIQSGMTVAQKVLSLVESTGGPAMLQFALPGIGLVVSACQLIMRAYGIYKAVLSYREMAIQKKKMKENLSRAPGAKQVFSRNFWGNTATDLDMLDKIVANPDASNIPDAIKPALKEYHLVHEMKYINQKRIVRESMLVGAELMKVAGEISIMTGAGAGVGVGLKGGAAGIKAGAVVVREAKQAYRDNYDTDSRKTTAAKQKRRVQHAQLIFDMIEQAATEYKAKPRNEAETYVQAEADKISNYLIAAGVHNIPQWCGQASKGSDGSQNAFVQICVAMQKRQFG